MKIRFLVLLICVVFITTSCSQNTKDKATQTAENISKTEEDFGSFLQDFNKKPTFQRRRVLFPLEAILLDPSEYTMQTVNEEIEYQEWILLDFTYDSTYVTRQVDGYEQHIREYSDSTIIEQRGIDNGIYANYYFMRKDGKWYLKSLTDVSF